MEKQEEQFVTLEKEINNEFIIFRKSDQYFPIYLVAKDNHSEVYALSVDYSKENLDLDNALVQADKMLPFQIVKPETLFTEIKSRIDRLIKERQKNKVSRKATATNS